MKKLSTREAICVKSGVCCDQNCTGAMWSNPLKTHKTRIYGEGPTAEMAINDHNQKLIAHRNSMPEYKHSANLINFSR